MIPLWAKLAAEDITHDDHIDEVESERTSTRDWLKWAIGAGLLVAAGGALYANRDAIKQTLGKLNYDGRTPSQKATGAMTGGLTSAPTILGGVAGVVPTIPGTPKVLRSSNTLMGADAGHQTIQDQLSRAATSGSRSSMTAGPAAGAVADELRGLLEGGKIPLSSIQGLHAAGLGSDKAFMARLLAHDPRTAPTMDWDSLTGKKLAPNEAYGLGRHTAKQQSDLISQRLQAFQDQLDTPVKIPGTAGAAAVVKPLREFTQAEIGHLNPAQQFYWKGLQQAHREIAPSAPPAGGPPAAGAITPPGTPAELHLGRLGSSFQAGKEVRSGLNLRRSGLAAARGGAIGYGVGAAVDALAGK